MASVIKSFEAKELKKRPWAIRTADRLASFFGSFSFLVITVVFFTAWIAINTGSIPGIPIFDPYPFILLTTTVSLEAIILTVVVLMSQSRQSFVSSLREEVDMQVNLMAEREIKKTLQLLVKIAEKQNIKLDDHDLKEMVKDLEVSYIERRLEDQLLKNSKPNIVSEVKKLINA